MSNNGITVPKSYRHMIKREYGSLEEYKPDIRNLIIKKDGEPISNKEFIDAVGVTTATAYVSKLIKQGHILRKVIKTPNSGRGWGVQYKWLDTPLDAKTATIKNGGVVTTKLVPDFFLDNKNMGEVDCQFLNWIDDQTDGQQILGAISFRRHLHAKVTEHKELKQNAIAKLSKGE